jgi:hypothetical protein
VLDLAHEKETGYCRLVALVVAIVVFAVEICRGLTHCLSLPWADSIDAKEDLPNLRGRVQMQSFVFVEASWYNKFTR